MATPYVEEFDAECPGPRVIFEAAAQRGRDDLGVAHGRLSIAGDGSGVATRQRHGQGRPAARAARPLVGRGVYYEGFFDGEVAESAEGSRLLSGYRAKSSVQGSNPCLSATRP